MSRPRPIDDVLAVEDINSADISVSTLEKVVPFRRNFFVFNMVVHAIATNAQRCCSFAGRSTKRQESVDEARAT
jgi:hypothetical protein